MPDVDPIVPYVRAWVAARARGQDPAAADLCRDQPELIPALAKRLTELRGYGSGPNPMGTLGSVNNTPPLPGQPEPDNVAAYPDRIGDYHLLSILGRGGMGAVFRAEDLRLGRQVAVKLILPEQASSPKARARFLREARAQAGVENDHVVPIYQAGEQNGVLFIAMPLLQGETLRDRLEREPMLPLVLTLKIGREIADGLSAAHAKGVIHRDVKPGNVWLEGDPNSADPADRFRRCRVLDFGLARHAEAPQGRVTMNRELLGTPAYMSPEQASGAELDFRSDLFSLGTLLYELSTGIQPYDDANAINSLVKLSTVIPPPAIVANRAVPEELSDLIATMMSRNPSDRPDSAREVVATLRRIEASFLTGSRPANAPIFSEDFPAYEPSKKPVVSKSGEPPDIPNASGNFAEPKNSATKNWQEPQRKGSGSKVLPLVLGIGLLLALSAGGIALATMTDLLRGPTPEPKPKEPDTIEPKVVATVDVRLKVRPAGATLRPVGTAAISILPTLVEGEYRVVFKPDQPLNLLVVHEGFAPQNLVLDGTKPSVDVELLPRSPETVRVRFKGLAPGAAVKFLDDPTAKLDGSDYVVRPGKHRVEIASSGYETLIQNIEPSAGSQPFEVSVSLKPTAPPKAYTDGAGIDFVLIPMGNSTLGFANPVEKQLADQPLRKGTISKSFYLGKCEITRGQFRKFLEETDHEPETNGLGGGVGYAPPAKMPFEQNAKFDWKTVGFPITDKHPVVNISYNDARAFCEWMTKQEKRRYRLPTEAEWEHAARAGTSTTYFFGNGESQLASFGNVADQSTVRRFQNDNPGLAMKGFGFDDSYAFLAPVGSLDKNPHGLHDVYGNVLELCEDWFGDVSELALKDPRQTEVHPDGFRVARGGSFLSGTPAAVLMRIPVAEKFAHVQLGFRVLVEVP